MVDNTQLASLVHKDPVLKFKFRGCFSRDAFPTLLNNAFVIVNTDTSTQPGEHWLLVASKNSTILLYDSFGRDFQQYFQDIYNKIHKSSRLRNQAIFQYKPSSSLLQPLESQFCGIYCIFVAHFYYTTKQSLTNQRILEISSFPSYATEEDILRFVAAFLD